MNLRPFAGASDDAARLARFRCSTGAPIDTAVGWSSITPWDDHELWVGSL